MLVFIFIAFNLGLLALASGVLLLVWSLRSQEIGSTVVRAVGALISIISAASVIYLGSNIVMALSAPPAPQQAEISPAQPEMTKPVKK